LPGLPNVAFAYLITDKSCTHQQMFDRIFARYTLRNSAIEFLSRKRLGKRPRLSFIFKIHPTDICARNLSETDDLEFHVIEPRSHLAQLMGEVFRLDSYFDKVKHCLSLLRWRRTCPDYSDQF